MRNNIFMDIDFLRAVWGNVLGFIYQNIITLIAFILILIIGEASTIIEKISPRYIKGVIYFSGICSFFGVIAFILRLLFFRSNPYNIFITPVSSLKQISDEFQTYEIQDNENAKFLLPGVTIFIWLFFFSIFLLF